MDYEAALDTMKEFVALIDKSTTSTVITSKGKEDLHKLLPLVQGIAQVLSPGLERSLAPTTGSGGAAWVVPRMAAVRAIGILENRHRAAAIFEPQGPKLAAQQLHPLIWNAALNLWAVGARRSAVQTAATALEHYLEAKVGVPSSGKDAFGLAFSEKPPVPGQPRLRFAEFKEGTSAWTSAHDGARYFGMGCMQRIRNLATHMLTELDEQVALEQLAVLSLLARWVDEATVVTATST